MSALLGKAGKKLFERHLEQYSPADPLYEEYTDSRGRTKRRKRAIPPGLSARDAKILKSVQKRAHYLDKGFSLCGLRFGWTFIIGIIPGAGDIVDATLNYTLVVRKARKADIPPWLLTRMLMNNAVSAGVGLVPLVGDVVLAMYKANSRNAALLEEFLRIRGEEFLKLEAAGKGKKAIEASTEGGESLKGKGKGKQVAAGVTKADAEQVKPGSGMKKSTTMPGTLPADDTKATSSGLAKSSSGKSSSSRKGFGSFFVSNKSKAPAVPGDKGRFIENVDGTKNA